MSRSWRALFAVALIVAASEAVEAQEPPESAPAPEVKPEARTQTPVTVPAPGGDVTILADHMEEVGPDRVLVATGNVEVSRGPTRLVADRVEVNRLTGDAVAIGRVVLYDAGGRLGGERLEYNLRTGTGVLYGGEVQAEPYYRVTGERFERKGESLYHVLRGTLTTCTTEPAPWSIRFGSGDADLENSVFGTNASFWVRNLPLIPWFPFFGAALGRERQTGFLFPRFGHSSTRGYQAEIPFYWAISDSQDLTVALAEYTKKGTGLIGDYRYVFSAENHGEIRGFYVRETELHNDDRGWISVRHDWAITPNISFTTDVRMVTDDTIFQDYGDNLNQLSEQRVESKVFLSRRWPTWDLVGTAFWYQDLTTPRPVELNRLPDVTLYGSRQPIPGLPGALFDFEGSGTRFVRWIGSEGSRIDVHPRVSRPITPAGLFTITPFVGGRLTAYDKRVTGLKTTIDGLTVEDADDDLQLRRIFELGTDVSATASRVYPMNGFFGLDAILHTIEPHLQYLWVDVSGDHTQLPQWTDLDRIKTSETLVYALTNRIQGKTLFGPGSEQERLEMVRFTLGHALNFKAPGSASGDLIAQLILRPSYRLMFRGDLVQDTHGQGIRNGTTEVLINLNRVLASIGTQYSDITKTSFLQGTMSADITPYLSAHVTTNWDLRHNVFLENRFGFDLKFQCWAFSIEVVDRNIENRKNNNEVRFTLNLLGLGGPLSTSMGLGSLTSSGGTSTR